MRPPARGLTNINTRPRTLIAPTDSITSRSSASMSGATATIALLPQIAVPAPNKTLVRGHNPHILPNTQAAAIDIVIVARMMANARRPTVVA